MKNHHKAQLYSPYYQRVIIPTAFGLMPGSGIRYVVDTSDLVYTAETFVPFHD